MNQEENIVYLNVFSITKVVLGGDIHSIKPHYESLNATF